MIGRAFWRLFWAVVVLPRWLILEGVGLVAVYQLMGRVCFPVFGSRVTNHKKLSLPTQHLRPSRWTAKPYRRQLRFKYIIKISSRPIFDVENDSVVARLQYPASIDVSTAISNASVFGRFSWRRQLSSTIYGNNQFIKPPVDDLHNIDIYGR